MVFTVDIPFPVPLAACFLKSKGGSGVPSKRYRAYGKEAAAKVLEQGNPKAIGPVVVEIFFRVPDGRKRDGDNLLKCVFDTLVKTGVLPDDNNRVVVGASWVWVDHGPDCRVKITEARPRVTRELTGKLSGIPLVGAVN